MFDWGEISKRSYPIDLTDIQKSNEANSRDFVFLLFTGLKDKNGTEIYEGDVVDDPTVILDEKPARDIVEWDGDRSGFFPFFANYTDGEPIVSDAKDLIVIGNIYENPELVK